jgi:N-acetylmuramoyl-L-alanine amidase
VNHWFFSSVLATASVLLISFSADAAKLQSWQFNQPQNQLRFSTDEPVRPTVQFLNNPARLVIDLPNTALERRRITQDGNDAIDKIQIRRLDDNTARIIIELNDNYTFDPAAVVVQGTSATGWTVQLPTPRRLSREERRANRGNESSTQIQITPYVETATIQAIELAADGRGLTIRADRPLTNVTSGWDRTTSTYQIQIPQAQLDRAFVTPNLDNRGSLLRLRAVQQGTDVIVSLQPAPGVQIGDLTQTNQSLVLTLAGQAQRRFVPEARSVSFPPLTQLPNVANRRILIAIDPGHGGRDPGAVGINDLRETDIVLPIGLKVAELLKQQGASVLLTRQTEEEIDLEPRVAAANQANATLFVSIHANSMNLSRPDVNGAEVYYYASDTSQELAEYLQQSIIEATGMNDRGIHQARFYVLRYSHMPSILIEVGFVTGAEDAARLSDPNFRNLMAQAITRGILKYVVDHF